MAPATPFRFCVMQNSLNVEKNKAFKDLAYYSEWPKVAGAVIKALPFVGFSVLGFDFAIAIRPL